MNEETKLPEGLELAETLCGHAFCTDACTEDQMRAAVSAIRTEHAQRLTLQHHAVDLAQRVADLEVQRDSYKAAFAEWLPFAHYMRDLVRDGAAPADSLGHHCADVAIETIKRLIRQRDELNHQHHAVRADAQARVDAAVIRALAAEKERDEWRKLASAFSPAKELAEALKQSKASGDAARNERNELRARLAELERQEPVGYMLRSSAGFPHPEVVRDISYLSASTAENVMAGRNLLDPLYARPVAATPAERDVLAERRRQVEREGMTQSHDDAYLADELPLAACCYCVADEGDAPPAVWPWATKWWKPKDRRSNMVRAAALLLADIERVDRMAQGHKA